MRPRKTLGILVAFAVVGVVGILATDPGRGPGPAPRQDPDASDGRIDVVPDEIPMATAPTLLVSGLVLDARTHRPVAGAEGVISVGGEAYASTMTDDGGRWTASMTPKQSSESEIRVTAPGYVPRTTELGVFSQRTLHTPVPVTRLDPVVTLVSGTVVDSRGRPVVGARIFNPASGTIRATDEHGEFDAFPWGRQLNWLFVAAEGLPRWAEKIDSNAERRTRLRIVLPPAVSARCTVVDDRGVPVPDAIVHDDGDVVRQEVRSDADGRLAWPIPYLGCDWVVAEKAGYTPVEEDTLVHGGGEVRIVLDRNVVLAGRVVPPAGGENPEELVVSTGHDSATPGADGTFRFVDHPPGDIRVSAGRLAPFHSPRLFQKWLRYSDGALSFFLGPGERRENLILTLGPVERIEGRVVDAADGRPITGATVGVGTTDARGMFVLVVPRGSDPDARLLDVHAEGYLPWRGIHTPEVRLERWREVEIRVVGPDGLPVAGLSLWPVLEHFGAWENAAVTDALGIARCRLAAPGPSALHYVDPRFRGGTFLVPPGVERFEAKPVAHPVAVAIFVTDEAGGALSDAWVIEGPKGWTEFGDGRFGLPARNRSLCVGAPGRQRRWIRPDDWAQRESLTVPLRPAAPVRGRVLTAAGAPLPNATVATTTGQRVYSDGEGRFHIDGVAAGQSVTVFVSVQGFESLALPVPAGGPEAVFRFPPRGTIRVRVPEGRATSSPDILLSTEEHGLVESGTDSEKMFVRSEPGQLLISSPAGLVSLWLRIPPGIPLQFPNLRVPAGGTLDLAYEFPAYAGLSGTVTGPDGDALEGAIVILGEFDHELGETDAEGHFSLDPGDIDWDDQEWFAGPWSLFVISEDYPPHRTENVDLARRTDLRIRIPRGGTLTGRILPPPGLAMVEVVGPLDMFCRFTAVAADGKFRSEGPLPPGTLRLRVKTEKGYLPTDAVVEIREGEETVVLFGDN